MQLLGPDHSAEAFARLYFGVQRLRGGVTRSSIREVGELLDSSLETLQEHVRTRLMEVHDAPGNAVEWLERQPSTDRDELRAHMQFELQAASRSLVEVRRTSGSTGAPFRFVKDKKMTAMMDAVMWATYGWHGIGPGQKHARFWGMPRDRLPRVKRQAMDFLLHRRRLDAFRLSARTAKRFFLRMRGFLPKYIHAYPNLLLEFVEYCVQAGMDGRELGVDTVVCGGELLLPPARHAIGDFFDAHVVNEYGCSESGLISIDCEYGRPHVLPVAVYPQLLQVDKISDGYRSGEILITDLYGSIMPLIRYRLHDRVKIVPEAGCECGRRLAALSPEIGRVDSFIRTPSRGKIYDAILAYSVPSNVLRFRAYQIDISNIFVEVVVGPVESPDKTLRELETTWQKELGPGIKVNAVVVNDISRMESGKLAYFIPEDEVPGDIHLKAAGQ